MILPQRLLSVLLVALTMRRTLANDEDFVFTEKLLKLAEMSAELNEYWYNAEEYGFENFNIYKTIPNEVIVTQRDGYCFISFSAMTLYPEDYNQVLEPGLEEVCKDTRNNETCCSARKGFVQSYYIDEYQDFQDQLTDCADKCIDRDDCVVITGFSKGAAVAAVGAVALADMNPYVFLFGQPKSIVPPCPVLKTDRWFHFLNRNDDGNGFVEYDPVPFMYTEMSSGAQTFGQMIILVNDPSAVAYLGLDYRGELHPVDPFVLAYVSFDHPHHMIHYLERLQYLVNNTHEYPVPLGFESSVPCTEDNECKSRYCGYEGGSTSVITTCLDATTCEQDEDCQSGLLCVSGTCFHAIIRGQATSCMSCSADSECAVSGGKCLYTYCTGSNGLMDDSCACFFNSDCASGRCGWTFTCE